MHGEFCGTVQGNAGNSSKGPNKRRSILGRSFHIDLIPRHFLVPLRTPHRRCYPGDRSNPLLGSHRPRRQLPKITHGAVTNRNQDEDQCGKAALSKPSTPEQVVRKRKNGYADNRHRH